MGLPGGNGGGQGAHPPLHNPMNEKEARGGAKKNRGHYAKTDEWAPTIEKRIDEDEFEITSVSIEIMEGDINPPLRAQMKIHHEAIMVEIKAIGGGKGLREGDYTRFGAIPVMNKKNCFTVPMADEAAAERLVSIFQGHLQVQAGDSMYHFRVSMALDGEEEEAQTREGKKGVPLISEEMEALSVTVFLEVNFAHQIDVTHVIAAWERMGWFVRWSYRPQGKHGGGDTGDLAPKFILKMLPPGHWENPICRARGPLDGGSPAARASHPLLGDPPPLRGEGLGEVAHGAAALSDL